MKCPKCGYVGFEETPRCRHCGYDFQFAASLDRVVPAAMPVAAGGATGPVAGVPKVPASVTDEFFGPDSDAEAPSLDRLGFVDLHALEPAAGAPLADLPLAAPATATPSDLFDSPPPARPPLAVRRGAERPRTRPTTQVVRRQATSLLDVAVPVTDESPAAAEASIDVAPLPARLAAGLIDLAVLAAIAVVVIYFTVRLAGLTMAEVEVLPVPPLAAFLLGLAVAYLAAFTACGGQTLGKMAMGLRVVADDGAVPPGAAAVRAVVSLSGAAAGGLGLLPALFDGDHRGLHDRICGTRVIRR